MRILITGANRQLGHELQRVPWVFHVLGCRESIAFSGAADV